MPLSLLSTPESITNVDSVSAASFFSKAYKAFLRAEEAAQDSIERYYKIGGDTICLRFAGTALVPLITPALEHLAIEPNGLQPSLTICLWDSASTDTAMPPPSWSMNDYCTRGEVRGYNDGRIHTAFHAEGCVLSLMDAKSNLAVCWTRDANMFPYYESGAPLRTILHWWTQLRGRQFVHAAAVGLPEGGVLLAGKGGAGKSNTALACLQSQLFYTADDYCLLSPDPVPFVFSVYSTGKTHARDVRERLPFLAPLISNSEHLETQKALYFLHRHFPEKILTEFPLRAILLPSVTGRKETTLRAATPAAAFFALSQHTIMQLPNAGGETLRTIGRIVKQVPCFHLNLGTDSQQIHEVIYNFLVAQNRISMSGVSSATELAVDLNAAADSQSGARENSVAEIKSSKKVTDKWRLKMPIAFMIFNRVDTTEKVFESIRQARPPQLFVVADGARQDQPEEAGQCAATRKIIERVDWDCEVLTCYSDINLGCKKRVTSGLKWVFRQVEQAIILEDDCLPHPTFFRFCDELLERYKDDARVTHISGNNFQFGRKPIDESYYFSRYNHIWGWASWRRAWAKFDPKMSEWSAIRDEDWLEQFLGDAYAVKYWRRIFEMAYDGFDTWDYAWMFACWRRGGLSIVPNVNLVSNIGFRKDATHTKDAGSPFANMRASEMNFPLLHPTQIARDAEADDFTEETLFGGTLRRIFNVLRARTKAARA